MSKLCQTPPEDSSLRNQVPMKFLWLTFISYPICTFMLSTDKYVGKQNLQFLRKEQSRAIVKWKNTAEGQICNDCMITVM